MALPDFVLLVSGVGSVQVALMWWIVAIVLSFIAAVAVYSAVAISDDDYG